MLQFRKIIIYLLLPLLLGCGSKKVVVKKYYVIENPEIAEYKPADEPPVINEYCKLSEVKIYPAYASRQIASRNRSHEIQYYQNHEWAVRPQVFLEHLMYDYLRKQNLFQGVATRYWADAPKYTIETTVYNLEVIESSDQFAAHVHFEVILKETSTNSVLVAHTVEQKQPVEKKDLNLIASQMSQIIINELELFTGKISDYFTTEITKQNSSEPVH